jgi:hypothetical protein
VPYTLVLMTLDEGFRLMAHGRDRLKIGERVVMQTFMHDGQLLVVFSALDGCHFDACVDFPGNLPISPNG